MKIFLQSVGCRLNQSEIDMMALQLVASGHQIVANPVDADKVIINTCAVTRNAAKDSRAQINRARRQNFEARLFITGCYATLAPEEIESESQRCTVFPNDSKDRLINGILQGSAPNPLVFDEKPIIRSYHASGLGKTRAFVKVQDGCDNRCTFCVTTIARGEGRSRPVRDILRDIRALIAIGYQEVVITGVHLGSYGSDLEEDLVLGDLIQAILRYTDVPRLRLSSIEPWDINPEFFGLWKDSRLLPHLHVPLQSGSDFILRRMGRRTTRTSFLELVQAARSQIPNLGLSTDIIVGFPGETEKEFQESLEYVAEIQFSRLHVFPYSRRQGTAAAKMDGQVSVENKKSRVQRMINLGKELSLNYHSQFDGKRLDVLWEARNVRNGKGACWSGYTNNYIRVQSSSPDDLFNLVTPTELSDPHPDGMMGTVSI